MVRAERRTPLRAVVVGGCLLALVTGCAADDPDRVADQVEASQWPWEVHPPASSPSPTTPPPTQVVRSDEPDEPTADPEESTAEPEEPRGEEGGSAADLETEVITLTEQVRADHGCDGKLTVDDRLIVAAREHSADMVERDYFDHTTPDGEGPGDRAQAAGYPAWGGENIAAGYVTAEQVVDAWLDSDGHRANLLNCGFAAIGVGVVEAEDGNGYVWTQAFGWE